MKISRKSRLIGIIVMVFYVAGFIAAIDAIMTTRTAPGAIAWSVSLVSVPFVAVPAYLVLGRSKFKGAVEAFEERQDEIENEIVKFRRGLEPWQVSSDQLSQNFTAIRNLVNLEMTRCNRVDLLINGDATFDSILAGVAQAKDYVLFQFYMIHDDDIGRQVQNALIERANAGVRVFVLYDEIGSGSLPKKYVEKLSAAGVEVSSFKPTQGSNNRFQINFRNHRKMVVVDGTVGWIGGHNVGDEYMGRDPEFSPWRDTHVRLEGPVVMQLQATILGDWYWATRKLPEVTWVPTPAEDSDVNAMIVPFGPTQRLETAGLFFVAALNAAKHRIWLSAPYFVPDEAVMKALELASLRGVDVRIITTGKPDSLPVYLAAFHYIDQLRDMGITFYAYEPGFLHEKVMLIDDEISTVGTPNFDNRSFRLNFEVTALIVNQGFASEMEAMFEADFAHSTIIEPDVLSKKPYWWRLGVKLSRLASPVL